MRMVDDQQRAWAQEDAELFGMGFLVDGYRVEPSRVTIVHRQPQTVSQPTSISYWQQGCDDARAGLPLSTVDKVCPGTDSYSSVIGLQRLGYQNGWNYGKRSA